MSESVKNIQINYQAEATGAKFHASDAFVRGLMGPIGSGKSVTCVMDMFALGLQQQPDQIGRRRTRWAVVRNTYPELRATTIKTFDDWLGKISKFNWAAPITAKINVPYKNGDGVMDGTSVEMEFLFLSLDKPKDVKKLLSLELTGGWLNEAREIQKKFLDMMTGRVGRFPAKRDGGGPTWSGVIMDTNPPDDDHWWYKMAEVEQPDGWEFWKQPGALIKHGNHYEKNPEAENVINQPLGYNYWLRQIAGKTVEWIKVYVLGEYGTDHDGKPVYPEYSASRHMAPEGLKVYKGLPLILGWDFGLTPAVVICQVSPKGQFRVLDELQSESMGIKQFARDVVKPHLANKYRGVKIQSIGDPAGTQRAQSNESTCMDELAIAGIPTDAAPTNAFLARREAVAGFLIKAIGDEPGMLISPNCSWIRKGFNGGYMFERIQVSGDERFKDQPKKTMHSHTHDGLQYAALFVDRGLVSRQTDKARPVQPAVSSGWT